MKEVDILYVIGIGSLNGNAELKYSLRSVAKYCRNVGRVMVSGDVPAFVGGKAHAHWCHDISVPGKHWNMLHKIEQGIRRFNITEPFLFSCDDHFFTRDVDLLSWSCRVRSEHIYTEETWRSEHGRQPGRYQRSVAATGELLRSNGLPDVNTVWHGNMWIDPKYLDDVIGLAKDNESRSVYGFEPMMLFEAFRRNDPNSRIDAPEVQMKGDVKAKSFSDCMLYANEYGCFSTADIAWSNGELRKWFGKTFPERSEYEK